MTNQYDHKLCHQHLRYLSLRRINNIDLLIFYDLKYENKISELFSQNDLLSNLRLSVEAFLPEKFPETVTAITKKCISQFCFVFYTAYVDDTAVKLRSRRISQNAHTSLTERKLSGSKGGRKVRFPELNGISELFENGPDSIILW